MSDIRFGMPTLIELDTLKENVVLCKRLELDFVEINLNMPQFQPNKINRRMINKYRKNHDIYFTIHLPEDINVTHFNDGLRKASQDYVLDVIELAKEIEAPIINMHMNMGIYFTLPDTKIYLYKKYKSDYMSMIKEFVEKVERAIGDSNMTITIENTGIYDNDFISLGVLYLLTSKCFKLTWDIGHDFSSGNKDKSLIVENMHKLKHMHIHDAIGKKNHLTLYTGELEIDEALDLAKENDYSCVIETKTVESLAYSIIELKRKNYIY